MNVKELKGIYVTRNKTGFSIAMEEAKHKTILSHLKAPEGVKLRVKAVAHKGRQIELKFSLSEGFVFVNPNRTNPQARATRIRAQLTNFPQSIRELSHFRTDEATIRLVGSVWILTLPPEDILLPAITKTYHKGHTPPEPPTPEPKQETATVTVDIGFVHTFTIPLREAFDLALRYAEKGYAIKTPEEKEDA